MEAAVDGRSTFIDQDGVPTLVEVTLGAHAGNRFRGRETADQIEDCRVRIAAAGDGCS
jgi:hypothetical protein